MENFTLALGLIFSVFLMVSCDESSSDRETNPPETTYSAPDTSTGTSGNTGIGKLIKSDTGIFRGVTVGMPIELVKTLEDSSQLEEETEEYLDYIVNYNFPETAEVIYYFNNQKQVSKIETIIYPSNKDSQKIIYDQLLEYYNSRYGEYSKHQGDTIKWQSNLDNITLLLTKQDGKKVHDINLLFRPMEKPKDKKSS